jgi:drug/metabolite transporter (DMT)-like permease
MASLVAEPSTAARQHRLHVLAAFFAIYIVWGSTYLAIRVVVHELPPLFAAGSRFLIAGAILYVFMRASGAVRPSRAEWRGLVLLGALMFLAPYSALFWAERSLPSGIAAVLVATVPVWTALLQMFVFRREPVSGSLLAMIAIGLAGVSILTFDATRGQPNVLACLVVLASEISWALGTILTTQLTLPESKSLSAGAQMLIGGVMLLLGAVAIGEVPPWPHVSTTALAALAYLIVAGSLIAFTAYEWLLTQLPTTTVTSYAYVNPVVAMAIGFSIGGETVTARSLVGSAIVIASTMLLLLRTPPRPKA